MHNNIKSIKVSQSNVGYRYITFSNHDGKEWSIPVENMRVGLETKYVDTAKLALPIEFLISFKMKKIS